MKKNYLILLILGFGLWSCTSPKYFVQKRSEISKMDLTKQLFNYIPLQDGDLAKSPILDSAFRLLNSYHYTKAKKYLTGLEKKGITSPDLLLSTTFLLISKKKYKLAALRIERVNDPDYFLIKKLLVIDLNYELARNEERVNYTSVLNDYQKLIDAYPEDDLLKKIVAIRLKYIRYNY